MHATSVILVDKARPASARFEGLAPRAGFEPATNRLTAGCSTAELPRNSRSLSRAGLLAEERQTGQRLNAIRKPNPGPARAAAGGGRGPALEMLDLTKSLEATPGIEPGCADLQSAASPLRHVAPLLSGEGKVC